MQSLSQTFTLDEDGFSGSVEAYVVASSEVNLENFLSSHLGAQPALLAAIRLHATTVLVLKSLNVAEEYQGRGFGSRALNALLQQPVDAVVLVMDRLEEQRPGFSLDQFYSQHDFQVIAEHMDSPVMLYPSEIAKAIKSQLGG
jgi:GNAT superfamily N-acetyltransferase